MARTDGKAENQHWVPEMLLRNFATPSRGSRAQVCVFDKSDGRSFRASTGKIANERNFYEASVAGDLTASLEQGLSELETASTEPFKKLLQARRLDVLTPEDRAQISMFLATQFVRTKTFRETQRDIDAKTSEWLRSGGFDPAKVKGWKPLGGEQEAKLFQMSFLSRKGKDVALAMACKHWILLETDPVNPFWISDNPIAMHNEVDHGPFGNIGLAVPGIQIYLPLSPSLLLGLWCFSWREKVMNTVRDTEQACARMRDTWCKSALYAPGVDDVILTHVYGAKRASHRAAVEAIDAGTPVKCSPDNLVFFNWLQLRWAERQLYSASENFELAREILRKDPGFRNPPRMTLE